jgi:hypothetical protein
VVHAAGRAARKRLVGQIAAQRGDQVLGIADGGVGRHGHYQIVAGQAGNRLHVRHVHGRLLQRHGTDHDHAADQQRIGVLAMAFDKLCQADGAALAAQVFILHAICRAAGHQGRAQCAAGLVPAAPGIGRNDDAQAGGHALAPGGSARRMGRRRCSGRRGMGQRGAQHGQGCALCQQLAAVLARAVTGVGGVGSGLRKARKAHAVSNRVRAPLWAQMNQKSRLCKHVRQLVDITQAVWRHGCQMLQARAH